MDRPRRSDCTAGLVDHKREHRTPPLARVMGVGRQQHCAEVMGPHCLILEERVAAAIKGLKIGKAAGPTGVVSEVDD